MNFDSRLKFNLRSCLLADGAHGAEDSFDSRPVRAEMVQLGFEGLAEVERVSCRLVVGELRVDQCE